ncbi:MAG: hypothetical protein J6Y28_03975 [Acholeplasmatales bacterium]|nr:hypothetical protein [Methanobrevibacter sp.]MBP5445310.1 hypothetical protein [Acholeplasmatales bacterium]
MKKYTAKELKDFVDRAYNLDRIEIALEYIGKLTYISKDLYYQLCMDLFERREEIRKHYRWTSSYEGNYNSSCPWNAPGMSIRDFI